MIEEIRDRLLRIAEENNPLIVWNPQLWPKKPQKKSVQMMNNTFHNNFNRFCRKTTIKHGVWKAFTASMGIILYQKHSYYCKCLRSFLQLGVQNNTKTNKKHPGQTKARIFRKQLSCPPPPNQSAKEQHMMHSHRRRHLSTGRRRRGPRSPRSSLCRCFSDLDAVWENIMDS